jgi:hypothetical protein
LGFKPSCLVFDVVQASPRRASPRGSRMLEAIEGFWEWELLQSSQAQRLISEDSGDL